MFDELAGAPGIYRPTKFWEHYAELNLQQLNESGFEEFKRTVNRNYFQFQFTHLWQDGMLAMLPRWLRRPNRAALTATYAPGLELPLPGTSKASLKWRRFLYARYVAILRDFVRSKDTLKLLDRLDEPETGHPICLDFHGHRVSEDLCNSVLELSAVVDAVPVGTLDRATVIELGSGYGRLAWAYLEAFPSIRYVLVDIPPALGIAEQYLSEVFPDRRVFGFRHFSDEREVCDELDSAQIAFLTPNQLDLLPSLKSTLFLNISSLHEMVPEQIANYLKIVDRHCDGWFYSKQWIRSLNRQDRVVVGRRDYPIPEQWDEIFNRRHPVLPRFFEALYRSNPARVG